MKSLTEFITESTIIESETYLNLQPIHLFDSSNYKQELYDKIVSDLNSEWPAALQDCHEDEYVYLQGKLVNNTTSDISKICDYLYKNCKALDGVSTLGIGSNYFGWTKYAYKPKMPVYILNQGTNGKPNESSIWGSTRVTIFGPNEFFEQF